MIATVKSELRKLLSIRSTYILVLSAIALITLFTYFGTSASTYEEAICEPTGEVLYSRDQMDPRLQEKPPEEVCEGTVNYTKITDNNLPKEKLLFNLQEMVPIMVTFVSIILILLMVHEYRYNMVNYTFTISNSRSKVLASKLIISTIFTILMTLSAMGLCVAVTQIAINVKDLVLPAQDYEWLYITARHVAHALGYVLFYLGIATLLRNLTASIAAIFLLPTIDSLAGFLLSTRDIEPTKALPLVALDRFGNVASDITTGTADVGENFLNSNPGEQATVLVALAVFGAYLVGIWLLAWILFLRRDAN